MKKIIGMIRPFAMEQSLIVFEDGNKIDMITTSMDNLNQSVFALMNKHNCYRLDLAGPRKYMNGLAEEIKKAKAESQYSLENLEINVI